MVQGRTAYGAEDAGVVQGRTAYGAEDAKVGRLLGLDHLASRGLGVTWV